MCVSDYFSHSFVIYETSGKFVTSFGKFGENEGEFYGPRSITSCANGFLYICDWHNGRVQICMIMTSFNACHLKYIL